MGTAARLEPSSMRTETIDVGEARTVLVHEGWERLNAIPKAGIYATFQEIVDARFNRWKIALLRRQPNRNNDILNSANRAFVAAIP
ncbi:MAG: hypothetical protein ACR2RA_09535 [Geminicoccaceae bacterium]